jgi:hypothetical protein
MYIGRMDFFQILLLRDPMGRVISILVLATTSSGGDNLAAMISQPLVYTSVPRYMQVGYWGSRGWFVLNM